MTGRTAEDAVRAPSPGRPRLRRPRRPGGGGREEILDAAAELFTEHGYAATSTRRIAEAVGIRQASLYYHFPAKGDILAALLTRTVRPSVEHAVALRGRDDLSHAERLTALVGFDARLLCESHWNLGALYLLPEVRTGGFDAFRRDRAALQDCYRDFVTAGAAAGAFVVSDPARAAAVIFSLVEGVIIQRVDELHPDPHSTAEEVCQAALKILGG